MTNLPSETRFLKETWFLNPDELKEFSAFFPRYSDSRTYGAIVGIRIDEDADKFAYRNGLFVLTVGGEGMLKMLNDEKFQPIDFSTMKAQQSAL